MPSNIPLNKDYPEIRLVKSDIVSDEFQQMADATIYGTQGKMRYGHMNAVEKIKTLIQTSFVEFKRSDKTIGIVALVGRQVNVGSRQVTGLYVRYFSINAPMRSSKQRAKKEGEKRGQIHRIIGELFEDPLRLVVDHIGEISVIYATVESLNARSLNMVRSMGFEQSRSLVTILFSRFYPKEKLLVTYLDNDRTAEMNNLVSEFYNGYNLVPKFDDWKNYFVHEVEGELVCGVKLETNTWNIYEMPGFDGWLFRKILPHIPILKRIFQGDKFDFIGIERLYVKSGYEYLLPDLLETLCSRFEKTKALIGVDNDSPVYEILKTNGKLGILEKLITPSPGLLFTRTYGLTDAEKRYLNNKPFYVSTYDIS